MSILTQVQIFNPSITQPMVDFYVVPLLAQIQPCLDNYTEAEQEQALALYVLHSVMLNQGGQVTSESTRTGASRSYAALQAGVGLSATHYGNQLLALSGAADCIKAAIDKPQRFARSVNGGIK
jgi:hypothetical protein